MSSDWTPSVCESQKYCTHGMKANRQKEFQIRLAGEQIYGLLRILESVALRSDDFTEVEDCVLAARLIREQAKAQGF